MGIRLAWNTERKVGQVSKYCPLGLGQGAWHWLLYIILTNCFTSEKSDTVSEKHAIHLYVPQVALCLVPSRSSKYCLNVGMTNQQVHAQPLYHIALLDLFLIAIWSH